MRYDGWSVLQYFDLEMPMRPLKTDYPLQGIVPIRTAWDHTKAAGEGNQGSPAQVE